MKKFPLICWMCDCSIIVLLTGIDSALTTRWGPNILLRSILLWLIVHLTFSTHKREGCSSHYSVCLPVCLSCFDFGDNRQFADDLGMKLLRTMRLQLFKKFGLVFEKQPSGITSSDDDDDKDYHGCFKPVQKRRKSYQLDICT